MHENFKSHYFTAARIGMLLTIMGYTVITCSLLTGASPRVLLLLALFTGVMTAKELFSRRVQVFMLAAAAVLLAVMFAVFGRCMMPIAVFAAFELLTFIRPKPSWYALPSALSLLSGERVFEHLAIAMLLGLIYVQHDHIVEVLRRQTKEDTLAEQSLKHDIDRKEHMMKEALEKNLLTAENRVLEERTQLSQTLHDKLGHNINGSVYQLEAVKVIMDKDPEKARGMIQAVIDQLRGGMDEIRAILRNKRPEKHKLAAMQLEKLCEDCRGKGIEAELVTVGDFSAIPEKHLEVILDNSFEAVSNSFKYSDCTRITINIHVMNKVIRCTVTDNGRGCGDITEGMGISGMRRRVRQVNGILEISSEGGFSVNMLLPL